MLTKNHLMNFIKKNSCRVSVMVAHKPSELDDVPPVRKSGFDSRTLLNIYARSVTAAHWHSGPNWGFQPLSSSSILDGCAINNLPSPLKIGFFSSNIYKKFYFEC